ncbi:response regulator transcription factor [Cellulomonas triticagri]|uniref:DNA-binding response regulator n=1 Tax=Cellulomonas triticagri TaxID=2483352 RepID=A0A3M2J975_9CELL|nr:response regulator transcription factor [Cellulomonas triticagri]RMI09464.1 DNA-binding response regulator [Cellulomonas triticagri]
MTTTATTTEDAVAPVRVLVADDQAMIRLGLRMIVDHEPDLEVVGEAGDGSEAVALAASTRADVVLMDIRMPGTDGIAATRALRADPERAGTRVVILTTFDDEEYVTGALQAGADGFLLKDTDPGTLVAAVRRVHAGGNLLDPAVTGLVLEQWRRAHRPGASAPGAAASSLDGLTARERDVLLAVARGRSNEEAGAALGISVATVKAHVHAVLTKTGCTARTQLVVLAYEAGLVVPGER